LEGSAAGTALPVGVMRQGLANQHHLVGPLLGFG